MIRCTILACVLASAAVADDAVAPDYFVDTVVATAIAQQLARACPTLSLNPQSVAKDSDDLMNQLAADGITSSDEMPWAEDANTRIDAQMQAFSMKYDLDAPTQEKVCDAGDAEIADETSIGRYLLEVPS